MKTSYSIVCFLTFVLAVKAATNVVPHAVAHQQAKPHANPANAGVRVEFKLPPDRVMK